MDHDQGSNPYHRLVEAFKRAAEAEEPVVCIGSITDATSGTLQGVPYLAMSLEMVINVNERPHFHTVTLYIPPMMIRPAVRAELTKFLGSQGDSTAASH